MINKLYVSCLDQEMEQLTSPKCSEDGDNKLTSPRSSEDRDKISTNEHWNKNEVYILLIFPVCVLVFFMYIYFLRIFRPDIFQCHWKLFLNLFF